MDKVDILHWHEVRADFLRRLVQVDKALHSAEGEEMFRLQGKAQLLDELMNLPQTLILTREEVAK